MITQKELKEILHYNPKTGVFVWKVRPCHNSHSKAWDIAGCRIHIGYIVISFKSKVYYAHRLAWLYIYGGWPKDQIDHVNHRRDDNRLINLREATNKSNGRNQSFSLSNTSGITGICWNKKAKRWIAQMTFNNKNMYLGCFKGKFEAMCARKSAENKYNFHENHGV